MDENKIPEPIQLQNPQGSGLKEQFTTVTPVSKFLAMVLFIALPFIGFYLGTLQGGARMNENEEVTNANIEYKESKPDVQNEILSEKITESDSYLEYSNRLFDISFQYPEVWGNPTTSAFHIGMTEEEIEDSVYTSGFYPRVKSTELIQEGNSISFQKPKCASDQYCDIGIQIREYSTSTPFEAECSEGGCSAVDHLEMQKYVNQDSNVFYNGLKWLCTETYYPPGGNVVRRCRTYSNNRSYELQMGYGLSDYQSFEDIMGEIESKTFRMDSLIHKMSDAEDFKLMEKRYEHILSTVKIGTNSDY